MDRKQWNQLRKADFQPHFNFKDRWTNCRRPTIGARRQATAVDHRCISHYMGRITLPRPPLFQLLTNWQTTRSVFFTWCSCTDEWASCFRGMWSNTKSCPIQTLNGRCLALFYWTPSTTASSEFRSATQASWCHAERLKAPSSSSCVPETYPEYSQVIAYTNDMHDRHLRVIFRWSIQCRRAARPGNYGSAGFSFRTTASGPERWDINRLLKRTSDRITNNNLASALQHPCNMQQYLVVKRFKSVNSVDETWLPSSSLRTPLSIGRLVWFDW